MITTTPHSDAIDLARRRMQLRGAGPAIAAAAAIAAAGIVWDVILGMALRALP
jgi:hypothetical protein